MAEKGRVCVTGAGGYVASWLIKLLLSEGYTVIGTVRNPGDDKYSHLNSLDDATEKLKLCKADLLDFDSIREAVKGCNGVFHVACPVPSVSVQNPEVELVDPALKGTLNVLKACSEANVGRVVIVSSVAAVIMNPSWPKDRAIDESCWSDKEYCRTSNNWYFYSKTVAEAEAWEYAKKTGLDIVTVCPSFVLGPMLQPTTNASSLALIKLLKEGYEEMENNMRKIVDVRDVAEAIKLAYEKPEAEGRYICTAHMIKAQDLVQILKETYPNYNYPKSFKEGKDQLKLSSERLQGLGWKYRPLKETLVDSVESYKQRVAGMEVDHGGAVPAAESDGNTSNFGSLEIVSFDALGFQSEGEFNMREDEEHEEDEEAGEVTEEGETDGEHDYEFEFQGEMDPLSFAEEEDVSGLQPYERFERIQHDYEVLAARKRPAVENYHSEMPPAKRRREEEDLEASFEEIMESMNYGRRKKSRKAKQRGRRKGSKSKVSPEVTRKLGDATLHYAHGRFEEAIRLLHEVIRLAPNLSDAYHILAKVYTSLNDKKKALNFDMIAAHLNPKDASLWTTLFHKSLEHGDERQANYCLNKAVIADPKDIDLQSLRASLFVELGEFQKAADSYEQIFRLCPGDISKLEEATQLYQKCGQHQRAVRMLENSLKHQEVDDVNFKVLDLLASVLMESNEYARALEHIEHTQQAGKEIPLDLITKAGICQVHLGHLEKAEAYFTVLKPENASRHPLLIVDVADSLMTVGYYQSALKYYMMLEENLVVDNGYRHLKTARCYVALKKRAQAIKYYYKAVQKLDHSVDARLMLSSLLLEENRDDEAISVLSPPVKPESHPDACKLWCCSGKIKLKLSQIYKSKGSLEDFANVLFPVIRETLSLETERQKVRARKRLSMSVLSERVKVLDDHQTDRVFQGFRPVASSADLSKASRAKKRLVKKNADREVERAEALAAGIEWKSDDSDDESPQVLQESPLPDFLKDERNHQLIVDLCKSLSSLQRYCAALELVKLSLKLEMLSVHMKEELRTLGAQLYAISADPAHGWDDVCDFVSRNPLSFYAWNCFYKGILRYSPYLRDNRLSRHNKFLHRMRTKHKKSVPPILISAHQFTMISQHQTAAREYLEAYKLMPDNPLINLCAGTALINLALGHRLQNKHQTLLQGLAFLYNNSRICGDSQEALYNVARAYHHVGLVSLAATLYEKVLAIREKDYPIPRLLYDDPGPTNIRKPGYCNIRREAAYNLHLIYKESGASDLARQVLKDHVVL